MSLDTYFRCQGCGEVVAGEEIIAGGHTRAQDDGRGNPIPIHCGPVEIERGGTTDILRDPE